MESVAHPRRVRLMAFAWLVLCSALLGAATVSVFDPRKWRDVGALARSTVADPQQPEEERLRAMFATFADTCSNVELWRAMRDEGGALGAAADDMLRSLAEELR